MSVSCVIVEGAVLPAELTAENSEKYALDYVVYNLDRNRHQSDVHHDDKFSIFFFHGNYVGTYLEENELGIRLLNFRAQELKKAVLESLNDEEILPSLESAFTKVDLKLEKFVENLSWPVLKNPAGEHLWKTCYNSMVVVLSHAKKLISVAGVAAAYVVISRRGKDYMLGRKDWDRFFSPPCEVMASKMSVVYLGRDIAKDEKQYEINPPLGYFAQESVGCNDEYLILASSRIWDYVFMDTGITPLLKNRLETMTLPKACAELVGDYVDHSKTLMVMEIHNSYRGQFEEEDEPTNDWNESRDLPSDYCKLSAIFSKLSVDDASRCRVVCTEWNKVLLSSELAQKWRDSLCVIAESPVDPMLDHEIHMSDFREDDHHRVIFFNTGFVGMYDEPDNFARGTRLLQYRARLLTQCVMRALKEHTYVRDALDNAFFEVDRMVEKMLPSLEWPLLSIPGGELLWRTCFNSLVVVLSDTKVISQAGTAPASALVVRDGEDYFVEQQTDDYLSTIDVEAARKIFDSFGRLPGKEVNLTLPRLRTNSCDPIQRVSCYFHEEPLLRTDRYLIVASNVVFNYINQDWGGLTAVLETRVETVGLPEACRQIVGNWLDASKTLIVMDTSKVYHGQTPQATTVHDFQPQQDETFRYLQPLVNGLPQDPAPTTSRTTFYICRPGESKVRVFSMGKDPEVEVGSILLSRDQASFG